MIGWRGLFLFNIGMFSAFAARLLNGDKSAVLGFICSSIYAAGYAYAWKEEKMTWI